jgi:hypothetical protein
VLERGWERTVSYVKAEIVIPPPGSAFIAPGFFATVFTTALRPLGLGRASPEVGCWRGRRFAPPAFFLRAGQLASLAAEENRRSQEERQRAEDPAGPYTTGVEREVVRELPDPEPGPELRWS